MQAANEAELAAIRSRIEAALGAGVNEKRIADLLSLAQFQMLSRDTRTIRSPTVVLSMRPQRSTTLRCSCLSARRALAVQLSMECCLLRLSWALQRQGRCLCCCSHA